jgi:hypothetical protein
MPGGRRVRKRMNQMRYREARPMTAVVTMAALVSWVRAKGNENMGGGGGGHWEIQE